MDKATIGKILKTAREKVGLSINKVSTQLGTGHERVKALEEGRGNYGVDMLLRYAEVVGYTLAMVESIVVAPVEKAQEVTAPAKTTLHKPKIAAPNEAVGVVKKKKIVIEEAD